MAITDTEAEVGGKAMGRTINEVGVVAALAELHHSVEQVGHVAVAIDAHTEEGEVPLQDGPVVLLLDVRQLHLKAEGLNSTNMAATLALKRVATHPFSLTYSSEFYLD